MEKKKKDKTPKIRLQRSLLESNYTIKKNVNNRFEVGRQIFTLTNVCIHNAQQRREDQSSQKQNLEWTFPFEQQNVSWRISYWSKQVLDQYFCILFCIQYFLFCRH